MPESGTLFEALSRGGGAVTGSASLWPPAEGKGPLLGSDAQNAFRHEQQRACAEAEDDDRRADDLTAATPTAFQTATHGCTPCHQT